MRKEIFEDNAQYVRTSLVAYNAVFDWDGLIVSRDYLMQLESFDIEEYQWVKL